MANTFSSKIDIFFEDVVNKFEALNVTSKNVANYKPGSGMLSQAGQTFYRPTQLLTSIVDGRDISSSFKDIQELTVPSTLTDSHLRNVPVKFTGVDLNSPHMYQRLVEASTIQLSNKVDTLVANAVADKATLVVTSATNIDSYDEAAEADAIMLEQQVTSGMRKMLLNPRMAKNLAGDLAGRQTMNRAPMNAYEKSTLPPIAGFDTFRIDYSKTLLGNSGTGDLVVGGSQGYTPISKDGNGLPVDNRSQTLVVDDGSAGNPSLVVGDAFTIAGVNSVGHINKEDTGQLKTFRVLAVSGQNITISPAIVPADGASDAQKAYGNVTTTPADNAAVTILNTVTKPVSVFYEEYAIEIIHADYNMDSFRSTGKKVRTSTTDSGLTITLVCDSNIDTLVASYRMFIWCNVEVLNPEAAGIMLEGQV